MTAELCTRRKPSFDAGKNGGGMQGVRVGGGISDDEKGMIGARVEESSCGLRTLSQMDGRANQ
jgi:hypothetical protein